MSTHLTTLVATRRVRDGFQRRIWVRCWHCDLRIGPFWHRHAAQRTADWFWGVPCPHGFEGRP